MAEPVYRGIASANNYGTSLVINRPPGVVQGDILVAVISYGQGYDPTLPSGWDTLEHKVRHNSQYGVGVFFKFAGASEPSNYTFNFGSTDGLAGHIVAYGDVADAPFEASSILSDHASNSSPVSPNVNTEVDDCALIAFASMTNDAAVPFTPPAGFTLRGEDDNGTGGTSADTALALATGSQASAGSTGAKTWSASASGTSMNGMIALAGSRAAQHWVQTRRGRSNAEQTAITLDRPSLAQEGDLLVAVIATGDEDMITPPAGWTTRLDYNAVSGDFKLAVYRKFAGASEPNTYTWTVGTASGLTGAILVYRGDIDPDYPLLDLAIDNQSGGTPVCPDLATSLDNTGILRIALSQADGGTPWTHPTTLTQEFDIPTAGAGLSDDQSLAAARQVQAVAGAVGTYAYPNSANDDWIAVTLAISPATGDIPDQAPTVVGIESAVDTDGSGVPTVRVAVPAGTQENDLLIIGGFKNDNDDNITTVESGWTLIGGLANNASDDSLARFSYRWATTSEPADYGLMGNDTPEDLTGFLIAIRGADPADPLVSAEQLITRRNNNTPPITAARPSSEVENNLAVLFYGAHVPVASGAPLAPSGTTQQLSRRDGDNAVCVATTAHLPAGEFPVRQFTWSTSFSDSDLDGIAATFIVRPDPAAVGADPFPIDSAGPTEVVPGTVRSTTGAVITPTGGTLEAHPGLSAVQIGFVGTPAADPVDALAGEAAFAGAFVGMTSGEQLDARPGAAVFQNGFKTTPDSAPVDVLPGAVQPVAAFRGLPTAGEIESLPGTATPVVAYRALPVGNAVDVLAGAPEFQGGFTGNPAGDALDVLAGEAEFVMQGFMVTGARMEIHPGLITGKTFGAVLDAADTQLEVYAGAAFFATPGVEPFCTPSSTVTLRDPSKTVTARRKTTPVTLRRKSTPVRIK